MANIDWPSSRTLTTRQQQDELRAMVASAAGLRLNALLVQARPTGDALYPSEIEPWSEFLTGRSGRAPDPPYDPLAMWVEECHAAAIECHVWFNPFRTRHFEAKGPDAPTHINNTRKDLTHRYDRFTWMDPGEPDAQDHSIRVMLDVVSRYNIDGVHIDDYFYPYPEAKRDFPDDVSWGRYTKSGGTLSRADWRRENINRFVKRLYEEVKRIKPHVRVGISPFGIWQPGFPAGVDGFNAHEKLYADARLWLRNGWLDYAAPQLYWKRSAPKQAFEPLLDWWIGESPLGRPIFPGLYASKCDPAEGKWPASEITDQIAAIRSRPPAGGEIHFSMKALMKNYGGLGDALVAGPYATMALPPVCETCGDAEAPGVDARAEFEPGGVSLTWSSGIECETLVAAWKYEEEWTYQAVSSRAGGVDHGPCDVAAVAAVGRNGRIGAWRTFAP